MINESTWGYRQELKTHSLKLARRILVCVGSSAFLWSWSPLEEDSQPTQASCEHSGGNTTKLRNNSCKKTKGVFCIWCLFAKQWTSLLLKKGWLSCQKCYTPLALGKKVTGYCKWRCKTKGELELRIYSHLSPEVLLRNLWPDHRHFQKQLSNQKKRTLLTTRNFPLLWLWAVKGWRTDLILSTRRNAFCGLRLRPTEMLRTACSVLKLLVEDTHGRGCTSFYVLLILLCGAFFPPYRPTL